MCNIPEYQRVCILHIREFICMWRMQDAAALINGICHRRPRDPRALCCISRFMFHHLQHPRDRLRFMLRFMLHTKRARCTVPSTFPGSARMCIISYELNCFLFFRLSPFLVHFAYRPRSLSNRVPFCTPWVLQILQFYSIQQPSCVLKKNKGAKFTSYILSFHGKIKTKSICSGDRAALSTTKSAKRLTDSFFNIYIYFLDGDEWSSFIPRRTFVDNRKVNSEGGRSGGGLAGQDCQEKRALACDSCHAAWVMYELCLTDSYSHMRMYRKQSFKSAREYSKNCDGFNFYGT